MISERDGDIFTQKDLTHISHQCNLFHTFGSGIAADIRKRFPQALEADKRTAYGVPKKLGQYSKTAYRDGSPIIVNIYSQNGISPVVRQTNYAALGMAFFMLEKELQAIQALSGEDLVLGIPYKIGCGLGGGDWSVVKPILHSVFEESPVHAVICKRKEDA